MEVGAQVLTDLTVIPLVANAVVGKVANLLREVPVGVVSDAVRSETTLTHLAETSKATSSPTFRTTLSRGIMGQVKF